MFKVEKVTDAKGRVLIQDPPIARFLFQSTTVAPLWLVIRAWLGWQFFTAGQHKFEDPAWMDGSGRGIIGFWKNALAVSNGKPVITFDWYRGFIQLLVDSHSEGWFSYVIVFGELAVGLGLILGALTGLAAAGGLLMSMAFLLAGTSSTNPLLAMLAILVILAWKNAGQIGLDRYLLPMLGTPWTQPRVASTSARLPATAWGVTRAVPSSR